MAWQPHLLLMVVSAKLLSDTEGLLQVLIASAAQQLGVVQLLG